LAIARGAYGEATDHYRELGCTKLHLRCRRNEKALADNSCSRTRGAAYHSGLSGSGTRKCKRVLSGKREKPLVLATEQLLPSATNTIVIKVDEEL
jgi:hypothetical protein